MRQSAPMLRSAALLVALGATGLPAADVCAGQVTAALVRLDPAAPAPADVRLAATFVLLGAAGLLLGWCWLLLCAVVALRDACSGRPVSAPGLLRPAALRAVLGLAAVGAVAGVGPAHAVPPPGPDRPAATVPFPTVVAGLPLPDRVHDDTASPPRHHQAARDPAAPPPALTVRVRPGDSLWELTEELVRTRSGSTSVPVQAIDRGWRLLHRTNRLAVGPDPDLLRPGTLLRVPAPLAPPHPPTGDLR